MGRLGFIGLILALVVGLSLSLIYIGGGIQSLTAPFRGSVEQKERVVGDGDYRIAHRDEFYQLCSAIQSKDDQVKVLEDEMKTTDDEDRKATLQSGITAQRNTKAELVNKYNAKAANTTTQGKWRDKSLPYHIDSDKEVECGSS